MKNPDQMNVTGWDQRRIMSYDVTGIPDEQIIHQFQDEEIIVSTEMHYNSTCETLPQPFEYRVTLSEGRELPSCFYYEPILKQVSIKALSKFHAGDYLIMVDYFYSNLWYNKQGYVNVSIIANFYPPRFKESLPQLLYIYQNKLTYFNLPSLVDFDGDNSLIDEVKFSNGAAEFIGFYSTQGRLKFSPTLITALGLHKVTLKLCDDNKHQLCKKEVLKVQVVPPKSQEFYENKNSSNHQGIEREIRCKAITIDTLGMVRIGFSEEITLQNSDIDIKIVKDDVEYPLKFKFTKQTGTRIMLQLTNLEEFYPISPFQNQDLIKITFNKNLTTKYQNQERAGIIEKTVLYKKIPMQIESEPERAIFEQLQKIGPPIFFSVTSISFAGALIAQTSMSSFWGMINILQLITIQSLMSINIPGFPRSVNVLLLQMANADLIPYSAILEQLFTHDEMDDEPVNEFFEQGGFESTQSVLNLGSSFIYQALSIPLFLVTLLNAKFHCPKQVKEFQFIFRKCRSQKYWLSKFRWDYFIKLLFEDYLITIMSVGINFYSLDRKTNLEITSLASTAILGLASILAPPLIFLLLKTSDINSKAFKEKYSALIEGLKESKKLLLIQNVWFLVRRLFTAIVLLGMVKCESFQPICLVIISVVNQVVLIRYKPFESKFDNNLEIFNEVCVMYCSFAYLYMTDFIGDIQIKLYAGWALAAITLLTILVNSLIALFLTLAQLYIKTFRKCKLCIRKLQSRYSKNKTVKMLPNRLQNDDALYATMIDDLDNSHTNEAYISTKIRQQKILEQEYRRQPSFFQAFSMQRYEAQRLQFDVKTIRS
ncbi:hypothetical protein FGO68_gene6833 [Halteria grandinella]|uniref:TRP C-terminal domain-containing protein n=1 Tax=Halteria grandinella TaxID=5974 RepID=A0A8J8P2S0_HALGN|nr:hypothetical protein FGO68_gene6833 [Halteria grandinella]